MKPLRLLGVCFALTLTTALYAERLPYPIDTIHGELVYRYTVEKSIGLYRIGVNFGVKQEDIIRLNPHLKERGLRYEEVIFIPVIEPASVDTIASITPIVPIASIVPIDTIETQNALVFAPADSLGEAVHLALLLPLQSTLPNRDAVSERFMEFYEGVLLALYRMHDSTQIRLHVYDVGRGIDQIDQLIQSGVLSSMDAILGPAYPSQVAAVANMAKADSVPVWIPFTDRVTGIETNPFLFQFNPTIQAEAIALADYLESRKDSIHLVFVEAEEADIPYSIREIRQQIRQRDISYSLVSVHDLLLDSLHLALKDSVENILLLNTEKFVNAQIALSHVPTGKGNHHVTIISQYSWQKEKILLPQVFTSVFAVHDSTAVQAYEADYTRFFHHDPVSSTPRYDWLGYDLMRMLWAWMHGEEYTGIQSDIHLEPITADGGYINTHVEVIRR